MRGKLMANSNSHYLPAQNTFKDNKNPNFKYTKPLLSFVHYENTFDIYIYIYIYIYICMQVPLFSRGDTHMYL